MIVVPGAMPRPLTGVPTAREPPPGAIAKVSVLEPEVVVALTGTAMLPDAVALLESV